MVGDFVLAVFRPFFPFVAFARFRALFWESVSFLEGFELLISWLSLLVLVFIRYPPLRLLGGLFSFCRIHPLLRLLYVLLHINHRFIVTSFATKYAILPTVLYTTQGSEGLDNPSIPVVFFCLFFHSDSNERGEALGGGGALLSSLFPLYSLPLFPFPLSLSISPFAFHLSSPDLQTGSGFSPLMVRLEHLIDRTWPVDRIFWVLRRITGPGWAGQGGKVAVAPCLDSFLSCLTLAWFGLAVGWLYYTSFRSFFTSRPRLHAPSPPSFNVNRKAREQIADLFCLYFLCSFRGPSTSTSITTRLATFERTPDFERVERMSTLEPIERTLRILETWTTFHCRHLYFHIGFVVSSFLRDCRRSLVLAAWSSWSSWYH